MDRCALCDEREKKENLIATFKRCFLVFNRYPYLPGHLLLLPIDRRASLFDCDVETRNEIVNVLAVTQKVLMDCMGYESCNIGVNTGGESGASIPEHLHFHLVPRRKNDMNFMLTCMGGSKVSKDNIQFFDNFGRARNKIIDRFVENIDVRLRKLDFYDPNRDVKRSSSD